MHKNDYIRTLDRVQKCRTFIQFFVRRLDTVKPALATTSIKQ